MTRMMPINQVSARMGPNKLYMPKDNPELVESVKDEFVTIQKLKPG